MAVRFGLLLEPISLRGLKESCSSFCRASRDGFPKILEAVASTFYETRLTSTFLHFWLLPSHFSARGTMDHPDRFLRRFLWYLVHERYGFIFCVACIAPFWFLAWFPRQLLTLFFARAFWTAVEYSSDFSAYEHRIGAYEDSIDIYASRGTHLYFDQNF